MNYINYNRRRKGVSIHYNNIENLKNLESHKDYVNKNECIFCLEDLKTQSCLKSSNCMHIFHESCIREWLKNKGKCPTCMCLIHSRFMMFLHHSLPLLHDYLSFQ